jgi:hypothetical protein
MSKKYVIANIRLPVEMLEDGTMKTHTDRADIQFETCYELPPINKTQNMTAFSNLQDILTKGTEKGMEEKEQMEEKGMEEKEQMESQTIERRTELKTDEKNNGQELINTMKLIINKDELTKEKKQRSMSTTFRNNSSSSHNYTSKKR